MKINKEKLWNILEKYDKLKVIICCVPPTMNREYFEKLHGPITHEFPFIGNNIQRSLFTRLINLELKKKCIDNNFYYLDFYDFYANDEGTLKVELSDNNVHILENSIILNKLYEMIDNIN